MGQAIEDSKMLRTPVLSRRAAFAALSVPAVSALASAARAAPLGDASGFRDVCFLTPQSIEGPFYLDPQLVRAQIAEGRTGVPADSRSGEARSCRSPARAIPHRSPPAGRATNATCRCPPRLRAKRPCLGLAVLDANTPSAVPIPLRVRPAASIWSRAAPRSGFRCWSCSRRRRLVPARRIP